MEVPFKNASNPSKNNRIQPDGLNLATVRMLVIKELDDSVLDKRETVPEAKKALIAALLGLFLVSFIVTTPLVFIYSAKAKKKIASNPKDYKGLHTVKNAVVLVVLEVILILVIYSIVKGPLIDFT